MSKERKKYDEKYEKKRAAQRTRNWTIIFYPEDLPGDWQNQIDELHIRWIEGPLHDKDINADGTPKKPHVHTLFMFESVKNVDQVRKIFISLFGESENESIIGVANVNKKSQVTDRCAIVRYMAHMDNPDKASYDPSEIRSHNGADLMGILKYSVAETREMVIAIEEFIEQNKITNLMTFSNMIRYEHPEWHTLVSTKMTFWFKSIINANYQRFYGDAISIKSQHEISLNVDSDTGEVNDI